MSSSKDKALLQLKDRVSNSKSLDSDFNFFDKEWRGVFVETLKVTTSLQTLNLKCNRIDDVGAKDLSEALAVNTSLQELYLGCNKINGAGAKYLSEALKVNNNLQQFELWGNQIGVEGAKDLSDALKVNTSLKRLNLGCNRIDAAGAKELSDALKANTSLQQLNLWGNYISGAGADLGAALQFNFTLLELELDIDEQSIKECLVRNKALAQCLEPIQNLALNPDVQDLKRMIKDLERIVPNLHDLPADSYPQEAYRLLTGLAHSTSFCQEAQVDALHCLLPSFRYPLFQSLAGNMLKSLLINNLPLLEGSNSTHLGLLIGLAELKNEFSSPEQYLWAQI